MTLKTSLHKPTIDQQAFRNDAVRLLNEYAGKLSAVEMLALGSHLVGQILALQDHRSMTPDRAMEIVKQNIEQGNREVVDEMMASKGKA
jgi:hypothetical protein